ncbi:MAG: hypothetical protein V7746_24905 [Halioglobus sp.]
MIDDHVATIALENKHRVLERSQSITRSNLEVLQARLDTEPHISWVKPRSGTTALLKYDLPMNSQEFCISLLKDTGVMYTLGSAFSMEGYIRIGYARPPSVLKEGLARTSKFLS